MATTRAIEYDQFGPPSVLRLVDKPLAPPAPGKVRVRVKAAAINPADFKVRSGAMPQWAPTLPAGIGREIAGVIDAMGDGVDGWDVGDEVYGSVAGRGVAEHALANPAHLSRKPATLDWAIAASLPTAGQTAWQSVHAIPFESGDTVLVSAAAGGVGVIASQLALRLGARVVGTASPSNHEFLRSLGIEPIEYGSGLVERLRELGPIAAVFDNSGAETIEAALAVGVHPDRINTIAADASQFGVSGVGRGATDSAIVSQLGELVASGDIAVPIAATFGLDEVVAAFELLEGRHLRGKVVILT